MAKWRGGEVVAWHSWLALMVTKPGSACIAPWLMASGHGPALALAKLNSLLQGDSGDWTLKELKSSDVNHPVYMFR